VKNANTGLWFEPALIRAGHNAVHNSSHDLYDFGVKSLVGRQVVAVFVLFLPLAACMGWGDLFAPKRPVAGDYFLMEGKESDDLHLFVRGNDISITGKLHRIGWNHQYIVYTDENKPVEWNVIAIKDHSEFMINDSQRSQDSRFQQIVIESLSEAWEKAKSQSSN
jgi:hypothetical protein